MVVFLIIIVPGGDSYFIVESLNEVQLLFMENSVSLTSVKQFEDSVWVSEWVSWSMNKVLTNVSFSEQLLNLTSLF